MFAVNFWKGDKHLFRNNLQKIKHKYPFILIQPQKKSEEILLQELSERKINVEYETNLESFEQTEKSFEQRRFCFG